LLAYLFASDRTLGRGLGHVASFFFFAQVSIEDVPGSMLFRICYIL